MACPFLYFFRKHLNETMLSVLQCELTGQEDPEVEKKRYFFGIYQMTLLVFSVITSGLLKY